MGAGVRFYRHGVSCGDLHPSFVVELMATNVEFDAAVERNYWTDPKRTRVMDRAHALAALNRVESLEKWLVQEREARWRLALELKRAQDMLADLSARVD